MEDFLHTILKRIRDKAIMKAEKSIDDGNWESAGEAIDIANDCDHICRKWLMMKKEHPDWFK